LSELASKFESDFSFMSFLSPSSNPSSAWYLDSGASRHMIKARELFNNFSEDDSGIHVELGNEAKFVMTG
jgi:hypothetical protein